MTKDIMMMALYDSCKDNDSSLGAAAEFVEKLHEAFPDLQAQLIARADARLQERATGTLDEFE